MQDSHALRTLLAAGVLLAGAFLIVEAVALQAEAAAVEKTNLAALRPFQAALCLSTSTCVEDSESITVPLQTTND
jgi:hypothetical protein